MYLGTYQIILGQDRQVVIPESLRELFSEGAYVTRGFEKKSVDYE